MSLAPVASARPELSATKELSQSAGQVSLLLEEKVRVGCSGWSYKDWVGPFYPKEFRPNDYLGFYSKYFDCVEIDSSFYRTPNNFAIMSWNKNTPEGFVFAPKLPKKITHENKLEHFESSLMYFYTVMKRLDKKLGPIVVQLPPSIKYDKHLNTMRDFLLQLDTTLAHAVEFRHPSWFNPATYSLLRDHNVAMVWSLNQYLETPPEVTADFVYLRMVGDRQISDFSSVQRDRSVEMKRWADSLLAKRDEFERGFIFFNNHFAGFGPESVNEFRRLLGMIEIDWSTKGSQRTLFE